MKCFFRILFLLATIATGRSESTDLSDSFTFRKDIGPPAAREDVSISGVCFHTFHNVADPSHSSEFQIQVTISNKRELRKVIVTLDQGEYGTASYLQVTLFSAATLSKPMALPLIMVGKKNSLAYLNFSAEGFSAAGESMSYNSRFSIADLLSSNRHNPLDPPAPRPADSH